MKYEIVIPVITFVCVIAVGVSLLISREQKRKLLEKRLREGTGFKTGGETKQQKTTFVQLLEKIGNFVSHGQATTTLWEQLIRAGYLNSAAPAVYTGIKILLFVIGVVGGTTLTMPLKIYFMTKVTLVFVGATVLFFIPNIVLLLRLKKRHDEICRFLPDAVDLLEICVSSGIGLDMAWNIVSDEMRHISPVLAGAMALTNFEIHLGASRVEAMRHMAARTSVDDLASLAAILIQTERFGTSIATALRIFAISLRERRSFAAEESAEKMAVKLIIPMVLFIFPAVLITIAGPAVITIFTVLK
jgi:tight adherence protein C